MQFKNHTIILQKSFRKTVSLQIKNGQIFLKYPHFTNKKFLENFLAKHASWLEKKLAQTREKKVLSEEEILQLKKQAKEYIPSRVAILAERFGKKYHAVRITSAQTRWGSCSSKKNLNFSYRLMQQSRQAIDYVIIHELAHLKHMNHSQKFWSHVAEMMPDYKKWEKELKGEK